MDKGLILALIAAVSFAISGVLVRKAAYQTGEAFIGVATSIFVGVPFFAVSLFVSGEWGKIWQMSWQTAALLGVAGILHFVLGRQLNYTCLRLIGANRGTAIIRTEIFYAVIFGIIFLNEPLTAYLVLGVLLIAAGATLVSLKKEPETGKIHIIGILAGIGGALFWGTSGILIKPAVAQIGSPYAGAFISYVFAFLVIIGLLLGEKRRERLIQVNRGVFAIFLLGGVFSSAAQLLRYAALSFSPVSLVTPLLAINVIITFFLSFFINRSIEVFTWKVFLGIVAVIAGTFLLFL